MGGRQGLVFCCCNLSCIKRQVPETPPAPPYTARFLRCRLCILAVFRRPAARFLCRYFCFGPILPLCGAKLAVCPLEHILRRTARRRARKPAHKKAGAPLPGQTARQSWNACFPFFRRPPSAAATAVSAHRTLRCGYLPFAAICRFAARHPDSGKRFDTSRCTALQRPAPAG